VRTLVKPAKYHLSNLVMFRPLAYSMLADLIHHVREQLKPDQIRRTVDVYTKNLHDNFPGTSFQTMSAKLLLNLAEYIAKLEDKQEARHFLIMILDAIAEKFAAMNRQYPNAVKQSRLHKMYQEEGKSDEDIPEEAGNEDYDEIDIFMATPIKTSNPRERGSDPVADNKFLFKNLMNGLKSMLFSLRACNPPNPSAEKMPPNWNEVAFGFSAEEVNIIIKLFREGSHVFRYYRDLDVGENPESLTAHFMVPNGKEEKELLETFATVFHCIDPATFHEVFHSEIPFLYDMIFEHSALLHVPQFFLASEATSPSFCGMLLQFLMNNIEHVGTSDVKRSQVLLRLFKLSFMAVTLFSAQNEVVLLPHVREIMLKSISLATTAEEPMNYFYLLRSLFRSIGGGRFEHLYKEILPLLEVLLENLNIQLNSARKPQERDLYVELCLTVPARLSNLLPHLSYLMKPLVVALRAGQELVTKGLKTLELCVDNLTPDYLDPIMAPYIDDLMAALWDHLKPLPYSHFHSHTTMRILGKLGGRNRRFLTHPPELPFKPYSDDISSINVKLIGAPGERPLPILHMVDLALGRILDQKLLKTEQEKNTDKYYKQQSLKYLSSTLKIFIGYDQLPEDFVQMVRLYANDIYDGSSEPTETVIAISDRSKSVYKKHEQEGVLRKLIQAVIHATAVEELQEEASALAFDVCRHFTILELGKDIILWRQGRQPFAVNGGEGPMYLDSRTLADAIGDCLASDRKNVRETAKKAMNVISETAAVMFGSEKKVQRLRFFLYLSKTFCHNCYEEEWYPKFGGVMGIQSLVENLNLGEEWLRERQNDFVRALLYVIKDMPQDLPAVTRQSAQETLKIVLQTCNKGVPQESFAKAPSKSFHLCALLFVELSNPNKHVRETVQNAFIILEEILGVPKHTLMVPVKERLLTPIFNKPLRALPFASQIGYIDAITYCLKLEPSFLEFNDEMNRLMMEALALADADDEQLSNNRLMEHRTTESVLNLRVVCIKLLSTAILAPEFNTPDKSQSRGRIISVFFKSLYYKAPEVIEAANEGLKGVLQQTNKLPRDLLQSGLRPILMNLSDPKRLNVAGLEGLARLLELLTNYFKVEIGSRLLEHLKTLAEPAILQQTSAKLLEQSPNIKIIAAILNVFHLLPPAAVSFMHGLFTIVLDLEDKLRRTQYSPVRAPLLKFINRYPQDTWKYILPKLTEQKIGRLFAQLLQHESSSPLLEVVKQDVTGLLGHSLNLQGKLDAERYIAIINAINIVESIVATTSKEWMQSNRDLMVRLLHAGTEIRGKSRDGVVPIVTKLAIEQASATVMEIFMIYLTMVDGDLDFLFQVRSTLSLYSPVGLTGYRSLMRRHRTNVQGRRTS
jgi:transformation/transcription domain-associated protein